MPPYDFFGEQITQCPLRPMLDEPELMRDLLRNYDWHSKGNMPSQGTWMDQSVPYVAFMEAVEGAIAEADKFDADKASKRSEGFGALRGPGNER